MSTKNLLLARARSYRDSALREYEFALTCGPEARHLYSMLSARQYSIARMVAMECGETWPDWEQAREERTAA